VNVFVSYNVGSAGTGTVVLTARSETGTTAFGSQGVTAKGVPFGPYDLFNSGVSVRTPALGFKLALDNVDPGNIIAHLNLARANRIKFVVAMTGGAHSNYLTNGKFDFTKWKNRQNLFNTQAIKDSMRIAVADGTVIFAELMDEPNHREGPPPGVPDWGGVMNHAMLDSMSRYTKAIFPTLKTGVVVRYDWQQNQDYQSVDVIVSQYGLQTETLGVAAYRDAAVASAQDQQVGLMFSMNLLDGGDEDSGSMTATQIRTWGQTLLSASYACGLTMWKWDNAFMESQANQTAFRDVAATAAARAAKPCVRP
jgi:hypothetical protein